MKSEPMHQLRKTGRDLFLGHDFPPNLKFGENSNLGSDHYVHVVIILIIILNGIKEPRLSGSRNLVSFIKITYGYFDLNSRLS